MNTNIDPKHTHAAHGADLEQARESAIKTTAAHLIPVRRHPRPDSGKSETARRSGHANNFVSAMAITRNELLNRQRAAMARIAKNGETHAKISSGTTSTLASIKQAMDTANNEMKTHHDIEKSKLDAIHSTLATITSKLTEHIGQHNEALISLKTCIDSQNRVLNELYSVLKDSAGKPRASGKSKSKPTSAA